MSSTKLHAPWFASTLVAATITAPALSQVTAQMFHLPGAAVDVRLLMTSFTEFDFLEDEATATAAVVTSHALITLFPDEPPFTFCRVHALTISLAPTDYSFTFANGNIVMDVTVSDLAVNHAQPFDGLIAPTGDVTFDVAPILVAGQTTVVNTDNFPMNITQPFQEQLPLAGRLTSPTVSQANLDQLAAPPLEVEIDPTQLPPGVEFFSVVISLDTTQLALTAPTVPALLGDADADTDIDLTDFTAFESCVTQAPIDYPPCTLFDFNEDNRVDLLDWSTFQSAFTGD